MMAVATTSFTSRLTRSEAVSYTHLGAAGLGHFDALAAGEIVAGDAAFGLADILHAARRHDLTAVYLSLIHICIGFIRIGCKAL